MHHLTYHYIEKTKNKEESIARQRTRKEVEVDWNRDLRRVIDRFQVATPQTVAACLGVNPHPQTPQERTALRILYRRLERNAAHGRFRAQHEYTAQAHGKDIPKAKHRPYAGKVFYVSNKLTPREGMQYEHKALIAHTRATLEAAFQFDTFKTDSQMRDDKEWGSLVYDFYGEVGTEAFAVECNLTDWPREMSKKCQQWQQRLSRFKETYIDITSYRYLWVVETERKAWNLRDKWVEDGLSSGHFLVTWKDQFTPYRPESILEPIWLWCVDDNLQSLRRS